MSGGNGAGVAGVGFPVNAPVVRDGLPKLGKCQQRAFLVQMPLPRPGVALLWVMLDTIMTIAIGTLTSGGIVLSADSRQTYRNNAGIMRVGSDTVMKLFKLTDRIGVVRLATVRGPDGGLRTGR